MSEAPERIWACSGSYATTSVYRDEYVRADIHEALEREVKDLRGGWTKAHEADAKAFLAANNRAEVAECKVAELEAERDKQREHIRAQAEDIMKLGHLVYDDADPPVTWKMRALTAEADKARLSEALRKARVYVEMVATDQFADTTTEKQDLAQIDAALSGSGSGWRECATEGCSHAATVRFERGGVGSEYCHACYMRIQALPAAPQQGGA